MTTLMERTDPYLDSFAKLEKGLAASGTDWIRPLRTQAISRFSELGFPTRRDEEWRHTPVDPIVRETFRPTTAQDALPRLELSEAPLSSMQAARLLFVNGVLQASNDVGANEVAGLVVTGLSEALGALRGELEPRLGHVAEHRDRAFPALNTAFFSSGALIHARRGVTARDPIHLVFASLPGAEAHAAFPRVFLLAEEGSELIVVEHHVGLRPARYLSSAVTEVVAGPGAIVHHTRIVEESPEAFHLSLVGARLERDSRLVSTAVTLGGSIVRNEVDAILAGEGVDCTLNGLSLASGSQLVDNHTTVEHVEPNSASHELYKGILDGAARTVFRGRIHVHQRAQKTDAKQSNQNLLLTPHASVNTKPQLEIFADDVKCTHGATVGELDQDALFYMRSRGLDEASARNLLTYAFASDVITRIPVEQVRAYLDEALFARLRKGQRRATLPATPPEEPLRSQA